MKHFDDFQEDQFDFHAYCLRKVTLRAYVSVLRFEDEVFGQEYYCRAASGIIGIYLRLFDNPENDSKEEPDYSQMSAAERKKAKAVARKKKKAAEKKEAQQKEKDQENGNKKTKGGKPSVVDTDPLGLELLKKDPLDEARKYAAMLTRYAPKDIASWMLAYDVAVRRGKILMALQALRKAHSIDSQSSELFTRVVDFAGRVDKLNGASETVSIVVRAEFPVLLNGKSTDAFVNDALAAANKDTSTSLPMRVAIAKALVSTSPGSLDKATALILDGGTTCRAVSVESVKAAYDALGAFGDGAQSATDKWAAMAKARFPLLKLE